MILSIPWAKDWNDDLRSSKKSISLRIAENTVSYTHLTPVNPMKNGLPFDAPWEDHMERDLEMLRASDAICLLPVSYTHLDVYKRQVFQPILVVHAPWGELRERSSEAFYDTHYFVDRLVRIVRKSHFF